MMFLFLYCINSLLVITANDPYLPPDHEAFHDVVINPLVTDPLYLVCIAKISTSKKRRDHRTNFL